METRRHAARVTIPWIHPRVVRLGGWVAPFGHFAPMTWGGARRGVRVGPRCDVLRGMVLPREVWLWEESPRDVSGIRVRRSAPNNPDLPKAEGPDYSGPLICGGLFVLTVCFKSMATGAPVG